MTRTDQKILFTALAFLAVVIREEELEREEEAERVSMLAKFIEAFCLEYVGDAMLFSPADLDTRDLDQTIERHIGELKQKRKTHLPDDRDMLIKLHDRLQQRKARRALRQFYAMVTEVTLADLVLLLLNEENDGGMVPA